jgi:hypothetical protein
MKAVLAGTLAAIVALGGCARARSATQAASATGSTSSPLVGSYRLLWLEAPGPDGTMRRTTDAKGSLIYTPAGQVSVQVMYATVDATPSNAPVQYSLGGYEGSFGSYVVNEATHTVTHRYEGANVRALLGQDIPRLYTFTDGRLIIRSPRPDERWSVAWERY